MTSADAAHLLRRAGFGGSPAEIAALTGQTRAQAVAAVMGFSAGQNAPNGPDVGRPGWVGNDGQWQVHGQVIEWWVDRMATLPNPAAAPGSPPATAADLPIYERLAFFWHDHFACAQDKIFDIVALWDQVGIFRRMAMSNFADLTRAVSISPAMLMALDNQENTVWAPQENFGRELMELYTCGVGHFTEADVVAMTAAWTGHNTVGWNQAEEFWDGTYVYNSEAHDHGQKTLFGITANWNGVAQHGGERDTIDELVYGVRQQATAQRMARLMFVYFANLQPSDATINSIAADFVASGMEVASLVRAVLEHDDFWDESSHWAQVKNPMDWIVSVVQQTGISASNFGLRWRMENMGMVPLDPPSVAGWGKGMAWLNTASAWARGGFAEGLRWNQHMDGVFVNLENLGREAAVDEIFAYYGVEDPSTATRNRLMQWYDDAHAGHRWSIANQARMLGALVPEFQVY
ncbi:MAG: DUF1800 family protein [Actinomycetota bacterium]